MNVLFICSRNKWRSRTAETLFRRITGWNARSAGTAASAVRKVNNGHLEWADITFAMENKHRSILLQQFPNAAANTKIIVLDIPVCYEYMHPDLVEELRVKVAAYV